MKKTIFSAMIASLLVFVGCQSEELVNENIDNSEKKVTLTASIAGATDSRVTLEDNDVLRKIEVDWKTDGEKFTVYDGEHQKSALYEQIENSNNFSGAVVDGATYAYYGYNTESTGEPTYNHLSLQEGKLDERFVLMKADIAGSSNITFKHKTAVLKLTFKLGVTNKNQDITEIVMNGVKNLSTESIIVSRTKVTNDKKGDIYVFLPIEDNDNDYKANDIFKFIVTINGTKYKGSLTLKQNQSIKAGLRYTADVTITEGTIYNFPSVADFKRAFSFSVSAKIITLRFVQGKLNGTGGLPYINDGESGFKSIAADDQGNYIYQLITKPDIIVFPSDCANMFNLFKINSDKCKNITSIDFGTHINTSNVTTMESMFGRYQNYDNNIQSLNLIGFDFNNNVNVNNMFEGIGAKSESIIIVDEDGYNYLKNKNTGIGSYAKYVKPDGSEWSDD